MDCAGLPFLWCNEVFNRKKKRKGLTSLYSFPETPPTGRNCSACAQDDADGRSDELAAPGSAERGEGTGQVHQQRAQSRPHHGEDGRCGAPGAAQAGEHAPPHLRPGEEVESEAPQD